MLGIMAVSHSNPLANSLLRRRIRGRWQPDTRQPARRGWKFWNARGLSGALVLVLVAFSLISTFSSAFYIHAIELEGVSYYTQDEILGLMEVYSQNIFWLDEQAIRGRLLRQPGIEEVSLIIRWPPSRIQVRVVEKTPGFIWQNGDQVVWVASDGRVMPQYDVNLQLPLVRSLATDGSMLPYASRMESGLVSDVLQLQAQLPPEAILLFDEHPKRGLGHWRDENTIIWYGRGGDMARRHSLVMAIEKEVADIEGGKLLEEINVTQPDHPFFRIKEAN